MAQPGMDTGGTLEVIAEIAVGFTGFAGIVGALARGCFGHRGLVGSTRAQIASKEKGTASHERP